MGALKITPSEAHTWLNDDMAAEYLGFSTTYFQQSIACQVSFPKPRFASKSRRWNMLELSEWMDSQPTSKHVEIARRPRKSTNPTALPVQ